MQRTLFRGDRMNLAVLLLSLAVSAITIISCGSGGSSNGGLCEQCGDDPDGPCQASVEVQPGPHAPACDNGGAPPCTVALQCFRKGDSAQRRCYPSNDNRSFQCDGEPADRSTPGPTATPTATASGAVSQQTVTFIVNAPAGLASFTLTVGYPTAVGGFAGSGAEVNCSTANVASQVFGPFDDDAGTLTLSVSNFFGVGLSTNIMCIFIPMSGETLVLDDLTFQRSPPAITVTPSIS